MGGLQYVDNETGLAMAEALKSNTTLQAFSFHAYGDMDNEFGLAVAEAFLYNVTLLSCVVGYDEAINELLLQHTERNRNVRAQRHALTELARCSANTGFRSLVEVGFRSKVLAYILPPYC